MKNNLALKFLNSPWYWVLIGLLLVYNACIWILVGLSVTGAIG